MSALNFDTIEEVAEETTSNVSDNIAEDLVHLSRGNVIANEEQYLLANFQYGTAMMYPMERYTNSVLIGPSSGGKTQVQKYAKPNWPSNWRYETSSASGQAFLDDDEWDLALMAPLDEVDKISDDVREVLKSAAGEDEGMTRKRSVQNEDAHGGREAATLKAGAMPYQILFAPEKGKDGIPAELDNRLLKIFVDDNKHIREAIGRKEFGHRNIEVQGLDHQYIYDTAERRNAVRSHLRQLPIDVTEYNDDGEPIEKRAQSYGKLPEWVWYSVDNIFDFDTTATNRFFGMVSNIIRSSAVMNHHNREQVPKTYDGEQVDAYLVEPQDVANVLCCQRTLLGTTHSLNPQKREILSAVSDLDGIDGAGGCTLRQIKEYLESSDMSVPSKSVLRSILKDELAEGYYIKVREGEGNRGADLYEFRDNGSIRPPRLYNLQEAADRHNVTLDGYGIDVEDPFENTVDPIRDQPFKETVDGFKDEINTNNVEKRAKQADAVGSTNAAAFMGGGADADDDGDDEQATLSDASASDTTDESEASASIDGVVEEAVYERVSEYCGTDGRVFNAEGDIDISDYHAIGLVDDDVPVEKADVNGTLLDPMHELWDQPHKDDDWVLNDGDAKREISDAWSDLRHKGLVQFDDSVPDGFIGIVVKEIP